MKYVHLTINSSVRSSATSRLRNMLTTKSQRPPFDIPPKPHDSAKDAQLLLSNGTRTHKQTHTDQVRRDHKHCT